VRIGFSGVFGFAACRRWTCIFVSQADLLPGRAPAWHSRSFSSKNFWVVLIYFFVEKKILKSNLNPVCYVFLPVDNACALSTGVCDIRKFRVIVSSRVSVFPCARSAVLISPYGVPAGGRGGLLDRHGT
jgi:hypothetical protein